MGILVLAYEGIFGAKERKQETQDEFGEFLLESYLGAMGGPMFIIKKTLENSGDSRALTDALVSTATPVGLGGEMIDASMGNGRYEGRTIPERSSMFITSKTPGLRVIRSGMALFGLSKEDQQLQVALKAFYRWKREELGSKRVVTLGPTAAEDEQFRASVKRALESLQRGEDWRKPLAGLKAEEVHRSILARRVLKSPTGGELTEEQILALRDRIGTELVDRLVAYDEMLRVVAYELVGRRPPRAGRPERPSRRQDKVIE